MDGTRLDLILRRLSLIDHGIDGQTKKLRAGKEEQGSESMGFAVGRIHGDVRGDVVLLR